MIFMLSDLKLNKKDRNLIIVLLLFSALLTTCSITFNQNLGIYCSDVYVYLLNALYFTGTNIKSMQTIYLSPIICFLTSILFRLGLQDRLAILIVTGIFAILGNVGLYFLLRIRFNELMSLCGTILYATFAINLTWLANGTIDIPATGILIWIVLTSIIAMKYNPKYYQIAVPLFVLGVFTRYTVLLIFPVLVLCYLYENGLKLEKNNRNYIIKGVLLGILTTAIILIPIFSMSNGYFGVSGQISGGISGSKGSVRDLSYNTNPYYYLINFLNFISSSKVSFFNRNPVLENPTLNSIIISAILAVGTILFLVNEKIKFKKEMILPCIILLIAIITFNHISSFITIILVFAGLLLIGKDSENKMGIVMLGWILANLIFFSYYNIKVNRYIIPAIPPLIYLLLSGIELINDKLEINRNIIPIVLIVLFLIQGFGFYFAFEDTGEFDAPNVLSDYIIDEIPDYENQTIGVYNTRIYNWYLGKNITGIESGNATNIDSANITYYISDIPQNNLTNFKEIKNIDNLYLYKKGA